MRKENFRIIDVDNFMGGNPLLVGFDWSMASEQIDQKRLREMRETEQNVMGMSGQNYL